MEHEDQVEMRERLRLWQHGHPHATFDEIEEAVQQEIVRLQAQLVEDVLAARVTGVSASDALPERPVCPSCHAQMRPCGRRAREVVSRMGQPVRVERDYYVCPTCGAGLFPP